jgi:RNA recognition motif-containing protein
MVDEPCAEMATQHSAMKQTFEKKDDGRPNQSETRELTHNSPSCDTTTLFVGGLHPRIGDLHLQKLFSPYGEVVRINIVTHNPSMNPRPASTHSKSATPTKYIAGLHQSKGFAFVEYKNIESARLAMSRLDRRQLMGRSLAVRPALKKLGDISVGIGSGATSTGAESKVTADEAKRQYGAVQSKIEAVKRAIERKKREA